MSNNIADKILITCLVGLIFMTGYMVGKITARNPVPLEQMNSGECQNCGAATIIMIYHREGRSTK